MCRVLSHQVATDANTLRARFSGLSGILECTAVNAASVHHLGYLSVCFLQYRQKGIKINSSLYLPWRDGALSSSPGIGIFGAASGITQTCAYPRTAQDTKITAYLYSRLMLTPENCIFPRFSCTNKSDRLPSGLVRAVRHPTTNVPTDCTGNHEERGSLPVPIGE